MKRWSRNRITYIHRSYQDFYDFDNFVTGLLEILQENVQYSLLLKVKFNKVMYAMVGSQIGFNFTSSIDDVESFENLHISLKERLDNFYDDYNVEEVNSFQVLIVRVEDMPTLKVKNLNAFKFNKEFTSVKENKSRFNVIPLTTDVNYFGKLILTDRELYLDRINKRKSIIGDGNFVLDSIHSMYLYQNKYIIVNILYDDIFYRYIFDSLSGILISYKGILALVILLYNSCHK